MTPNTCKHVNTKVIRERGFRYSVAVHPYTDENQSAHGNICVTEECTICGAQRLVNANQNHEEFSPWGPSAAERKQLERLADKERNRNKDMQLRNLAKKTGFVVTDVHRGLVTLTLNGVRQQHGIDLLRSAADQHDDGDGIVPIYSGLMLLVEDRIVEQQRLRERIA